MKKTIQFVSISVLRGSISRGFEITTPDKSREILDLVFYHATLAGQTQPKMREHYWVAVNRGNGENATVVVDVYPKKDNVEVVGWRSVNDKGLEELKRQAQREDGQLLILSPDNRSAAALSALALNLHSPSSIAYPPAQVNAENAQNQIAASGQRPARRARNRIPRATRRPAP